MNNPFSEAVFDMGWKLQMEIPFFGKQCKIEILAEAYREIEKATDAQIASYDEFSRNSEGILKKVQRLLAYEAGEDGGMQVFPCNAAYKSERKLRAPV